MAAFSPFTSRNGASGWLYYDPIHACSIAPHQQKWLAETLSLPHYNPSKQSNNYQPCPKQILTSHFTRRTTNDSAAPLRRPACTTTDSRAPCVWQLAPRALHGGARQ
ncbi:hypothetical protein V490_07764 [Pseudogymnoascus sp. VKM F-3557]|nr:hypothetical protein V490_07764 [Pseudogymnoascus sp. VKM F-3557]